jgi:isocitrate/isopropylmalate dehydrogenase
MLLDHLGDSSGGASVEAAIRQVLKKGICTRDMGGSAGTREFGDALVQVLRRAEQAPSGLL